MRLPADGRVAIVCVASGRPKVIRLLCWAAIPVILAFKSAHAATARERQQKLLLLKFLQRLISSAYSLFNFDFCQIKKKKYKNNEWLLQLVVFY